MTSPTTQQSQSEAARANGAPTSLITEHGRTTIGDNVVQKIVGMAAREVPGVYDLGSASLAPPE